jgi:hypothetical protein
MPTLYGDGLNCDADALEALMARQAVARPGKRKASGRNVGGRFRVAGTFHVSRPVIVPSDPALELAVLILGLGGVQPVVHYALT